MKLHSCCLVIALTIGSGGLSWGQPPPAPVATPTPPTPPDSNIRRHRMGDGKAPSLDKEAQFKASIDLRIEQLRARVAELEARVSVNPEPALEAELEKLEAELDALEALEPMELPEGIQIDPHSRLLWNRDGSRVVILDHEGESMRKSRGEKVAYFKKLFINHDDWIDGAAVAILGDLHVLGHVEEDAVSVGGNVYVDGTVKGNVVAPFGDVFLNEDAYVEGDVVAISVSADEAAVIGGKIEEIPLFRLPWVHSGPQALLLLASTIVLTKLVFCLLLGFLIQAVAPLHVAKVEERLRQRPVASFFGGVLVQVLVVPIFVLLLVTVIGIPVALLALPFLIVTAVVMGFVAMARLLGRRLMSAGGEERSPYLLFTVGALIFYFPLLIAAATAMSSSDIGGNQLVVVNLLFFLGVSILYIVSTAGMGAAALSRLGTRSPAAPRRTVSGTGVHDAPPVVSALPQAPPAADPL